MDKLLTVKEIAEILKVNEDTVRRKLGNGELKGSDSTGKWLATEADVMAYATGKSTQDNTDVPDDNKPQAPAVNPELKQAEDAARISEARKKQAENDAARAKSENEIEAAKAHMTADKFIEAQTALIAREATLDKREEAIAKREQDFENYKAQETMTINEEKSRIQLAWKKEKALEKQNADTAEQLKTERNQLNSVKATQLAEKEFYDSRAETLKREWKVVRQDFKQSFQMLLDHGDMSADAWWNWFVKALDPLAKDIDTNLDALSAHLQEAMNYVDNKALDSFRQPERTGIRSLFGNHSDGHMALAEGLRDLMLAVFFKLSWVVPPSYVPNRDDDNKPNQEAQNGLGHGIKTSAEQVIPRSLNSNTTDAMG